MAPTKFSHQSITMDDAKFLNNMIRNMGKKKAATKGIKSSGKSKTPSILKKHSQNSTARPKGPFIKSNQLVKPASSQENMEQTYVSNLLSEVKGSDLTAIDPLLLKYGTLPEKYKVHRPLTGVDIQNLQSQKELFMEHPKVCDSSGLTNISNSANSYPNTVLQVPNQSFATTSTATVTAPSPNTDWSNNNPTGFTNILNAGNAFPNLVVKVPSQALTTGNATTRSLSLNEPEISSYSKVPMTNINTSFRQETAATSNETQSATKNYETSETPEFLDSFTEQRRSNNFDLEDDYMSKGSTPPVIDDDLDSENEENPNANQTPPRRQYTQEDTSQEETAAQILEQQASFHSGTCCECCSAKLDLVLIKLNQLLLRSETNKAEPLRRTAVFDLLPELPLTTTKAFCEFSESLENINVKTQFEEKLGFLVTSDLQTTVYQMLAAVLTDDVANRVTWSQLKTNSRKEFVIHEMKIIKVMTEYLQNKTDFKDQKKIHDYMAEWIRRTSDRISNAKKKLERRQKNVGGQAA